MTELKRVDDSNKRALYARLIKMDTVGDLKIAIKDLPDDMALIATVDQVNRQGLMLKLDEWQYMPKDENSPVVEYYLRITELF